MTFFNITDYNFFMEVDHDYLKSIAKLVDELNEFNEAEIFYKQYYEASKSPQTLKRFLAKADINFIKKHKLTIPEIKETIPPYYMESFFFDDKINKNIYVGKHNRYSPALVHRHNFFELIYVLEGEFNHVVNNFNIKMKKGDICILPPGVFHQVNVFDDNTILIDILIRKTTFEDVFFNFLRTDNVISNFFVSNLYANEHTNYILFHTDGDYSIYSLILYIVMEFKIKEIYQSELIDTMLVGLFVKIIRLHVKDCEIPPVSKKRTGTSPYQVIQYLQDNYLNVSLSDIAEKFNYTPEYTSKIIKETTGYTFTQIIKRIRMQHAEKLLVDTDIAIADISIAIGYFNPEHFIRTFKSIYKTTPSEYRKNNKNPKP